MAEMFPSDITSRGERVEWACLSLGPGEGCEGGLGYAASLQAGVVKVSGERGVFHDGDAPTSISPSTLWAMSSCHVACHRHHGDPELYLERLPSSGPWALPY